MLGFKFAQDRIKLALFDLACCGQNGAFNLRT